MSDVLTHYSKIGPRGWNGEWGLANDNFYGYFDPLTCEQNVNTGLRMFPY